MTNFFFFFNQQVYITVQQNVAYLDFFSLLQKIKLQPCSLFSFSRTSIQHVLSNSRPDWHDWGRPWPHGRYEYSHTLQPGDAANPSAQLPGSDKRPCFRYST